MSVRIKMSLCVLFVFVAASLLCLAQDKSQTWTGEIGDLMCAGSHAAMGGNSARDCTLECVKSMGSKYSLWVDKKTVYELSDQKTSASFAGQRVQVTGVLDPKTKVIRVQKLQAAK